jgi:hypothetical protein
MKKIIFALLLFPSVLFAQVTGKIINNKPSGGTIILDTINLNTKLNLKQTTAGQTITLANLTSGSKDLMVQNIGTASVMMSPGGYLPVNARLLYSWTGTSTSWAYTMIADTSLLVHAAGDDMTGYLRFSNNRGITRGSSSVTFQDASGTNIIMQSDGNTYILSDGSTIVLGTAETEIAGTDVTLNATNGPRIYNGYYNAYLKIDNLTADRNFQFPDQAGTIATQTYADLKLAKASNLSDIANANTALNNLLPSQTSNSGKYLTTDGINSSWATVASGTVTSVSVTTANGVSGSVTNPTTTPAISLTLGAITPTSVNGVTVSGSSTPTLAVTGTTAVSGTNTGDQTITLIGDVNGSGTGSFTTSIGSNKVTDAMLFSTNLKKWSLLDTSYTTSTTQGGGRLKQADWNTFNNKQAALVSGTNIKTVNGSSLLGSGNLTVTDATALKIANNLSDVNSTITSKQNLGFGTKVVYVSDYASIQTAVNSVSAGADVTFIFPTNTYNIASGANVTISGLGNVNIVGNNSILQAQTGFTGVIFKILNCTSVRYDGLNIDLNTISGVTNAVEMDTISSSTRILNSDFYNFQSNSQNGIYCDHVSNSSVTLNFQKPTLTISGCNFYNQILVNVTSYDFNSNNTKGRGIYLYEESEYWTVEDCEFINIANGVIVRSGANGKIAGSNFLMCYPRSLDNSTINGGVVHVTGGGTNGSKLNIDNCKFNHNWGYSIYNEYNDAATRPVRVTNCDFQANHVNTIIITGATQSRNMVTGCYFDRVAAIAGVSNDPYTGVSRRYIQITNSTYTKISNNVFLDFTGIDKGIISLSSADYNELSNNTYGMTDANFFSFVGSNNIIFNNYSDLSVVSNMTSRQMTFTATQPSSISATRNAIDYTVTSAGTSSQINRAFSVTYAAGYTGSSTTTGLNVLNSAAGTGTVIVSGVTANIGLASGTNATTSGTNLGTRFTASNGNISISTTGLSVTAKNSATNGGAMFLGRNTGTSPVHFGVYAGLNATDPTFTSAALIADNSDQTSPIYVFRDNGTVVSTMADGGNLFLGGTTSSPTAKLHLGAGTATASTAPLKFTSGTNLTTAEAGAIEYDGSSFYGTPSGTSRYKIGMVLTGSATLDFANTSSQNSTDLTVTVTGAAAGDVVYLGADAGSVLTNSSFCAWVSSSNTVTVRFNNYSSGALDPASGTFKVTVIKN